jgi:hypothetical protein
MNRAFEIVRIKNTYQFGLIPCENLDWLDRFLIKRFGIIFPIPIDKVL